MDKVSLALYLTIVVRN